MKGWKPEENEQGFDMTPMIDVVFLLIAFFMTVASMVTAEAVEIVLPIASRATTPDQTQGRQYITISKDGRVYLGANEVAISELPAYISAGAQRTPNYKVYLRGDSNVPHKFVRDTMAAIAEGGVLDVIFATKQ